jgi:hypothetical protein
MSKYNSYKIMTENKDIYEASKLGIEDNIFINKKIS